MAHVWLRSALELNAVAPHLILGNEKCGSCLVVIAEPVIYLLSTSSFLCFIFSFLLILLFKS